jgi:hypothetical protein
MNGGQALLPNTELTENIVQEIICSNLPGLPAAGGLSLQGDAMLA